MYSMRGLRPIALTVSRNLVKNCYNNVKCSSLFLSSYNYNNNQLFRPISYGSIRSYSILTPTPEADILKYEDIKKITTNPEKYNDTVLIDVREPVEYQEGHIPGAINIPFKSAPGALDLSPEEFTDSFGFEKPSKDQNLIFYCLGGVRSTSAEELAKCFGYLKRGNYVGSYEDWVKQESIHNKPTSN